MSNAKPTTTLRILPGRICHFVVIVDKVAGVHHLFARHQEKRGMRKEGHEKTLRIIVHPRQRIQSGFHMLRFVTHAGDVKEKMITLASAREG